MGFSESLGVFLNEPLCGTMLLPTNFNHFKKDPAMSEEPYDTIHTGLYTTRSEKLLKAFLESAKDKYNYFRTYYSIGVIIKTIDVARAPDGEVLLVKNSALGYESSFWKSSIWKKSNDQCLRWIASRIKDCVSCWSESAYGSSIWDAHSCAKIKVGLTNGNRASARVNDFYFLHNFFLKKKRLGGNGPGSNIDTFVGRPKDPITTALEAAKMEEVKKLIDAHNDQQNALRNKGIFEDQALEKKQDDERHALHEAHLRDMQALMEKQEHELAELKKSLGMA